MVEEMEMKMQKSWLAELLGREWAAGRSMWARMLLETMQELEGAG